MINEELYTRLCDIALVAARQGFVAEADRIFETLTCLRPEDGRAPLAKAISRIYLERAGEAVDLIEDEILKKDPTNPHARGFLGFACLMAGRIGEGARQLRNLIEEDEHPTVVAFALSLLEEPQFSGEDILPLSPPQILSPIMYC